MNRILVMGGPRVGKTTFATDLSKRLGFPVRHTDDLIETHGWSEASDEVARWLDEPGPWIIEGVAVVRALRKWLAGHALGTPADCVHIRHAPRVPLTNGQRTMARAHATIWDQVALDLSRRGTTILPF